MRKYERLDKISENRESQRAYYIPFDSLEKALEGKRELTYHQTWDRKVEYMKRKTMQECPVYKNKNDINKNTDDNNSCCNY